MIHSVAFDLDGVLADFTGGIHRLLRKPVPETLPWDFVPSYLWQMLGRSFWRELTPLAGGMKLFREAQKRGLDVFIATAPPLTNRGHAVEGKTDWIRHWLPELDPEAVVFTTQKHRMASPTCLLIDDRPSNVSDWAAKGGPTILYPAPYNAAHGADPLLLEIGNETDVTSYAADSVSDCGCPSCSG